VERDRAQSYTGKKRVERQRGPWRVTEAIGTAGVPSAVSLAAEPGARAEHARRSLELWRAAWPIDGTPAAIYLRRRGIDPLALMRIDLPGRWPETLRFSTAAPGIALVVAVHDARTGLVCGAQRVFITREDAPIMRSEAMPWAQGKDRKLKRSLGDIDGNAARFSEWPDPGGQWGIAEGPETALAAQQLYGFPVWAAIHAGNMAKIDPPEETREIVIFADHDEAGLGAAHDTRARHLANPRIKNILIVCTCTLGADMADLIDPKGST
jgi:hypothetical protein